MARECRPTWDDDQEFIEQRIRYWVCDAVTKGGCSCKADEEDLAQSLRLDLLQRLRSFDPAKASLRTFITLVLEHRVRSLSEESRAAKRGHGRPHVSLDQDLDSEADAPTNLHEIISEENYFTITRAGRHGREVGEDLAIDLQRAQARLTAREIEVCTLLQEKTKKEAAEALGIPRTTLQDVVHRIGRKLTQAGLKKYCD